MTKPNLRETITLVVLAVWVLDSVNGIVRRDYEGLQYVTPIAVIIITALFVPAARRNGSEK